MKLFKRRDRGSISYDAYGQSDVGMIRTENQDSFGLYPPHESSLHGEGLFIVADGMGGHEHGQEASRIAVATIREVFEAEPGTDIDSRLSQAFAKANQRIFLRATELGNGTSMGTTCTVLAVDRSRTWVAHVGDSRAYRIGPRHHSRVTEDHTFVEELRREGILKEHELETDPRRHALTRAMGIMEDCEPDIFELETLARDEKMLLCSDGLAVVPEADITRIVRTHSLAESCDVLIQTANRNGGPDNVTVLLVERV